MIKLLNIRQSDGCNVTVDLIADTKAEVTDSEMTVQGLSDDAVITLGSTLLTTEGSYALRNSDGEWVWDDDEDEPEVQPSNASVPSVLPNIPIQNNELDEPIEDALTERAEVQGEDDR